MRSEHRLGDVDLVWTGEVGQGKKKWMGEKILPGRGENLSIPTSSLRVHTCLTHLPVIIQPTPQIQPVQSQAPQPPPSGFPLAWYAFPSMPLLVLLLSPGRKERNQKEVEHLSWWKVEPLKVVVTDFQGGKCQKSTRWVSADSEEELGTQGWYSRWVRSLGRKI